MEPESGISSCDTQRRETAEQREPSDLSIDPAIFRGDSAPNSLPQIHYEGTSTMMPLDEYLGVAIGPAVVTDPAATATSPPAGAAAMAPAPCPAACAGLPAVDTEHEVSYSETPPSLPSHAQHISDDATAVASKQLAPLPALGATTGATDSQKGAGSSRTIIETSSACQAQKWLRQQHASAPLTGVWTKSLQAHHAASIAMPMLEAQRRQLQIFRT